MRRRVTALLLFLVAGALLYAFAAGANVQSNTPVLGQSKRTAAPAFTAPDLDGKPWSLENERGNVVLVNFWATWCPPCRQETPDLVHVANQYQAKGLSVVGISMDEGNGDVIRRFVDEYRIPYRVVRAGTQQSFPVQALPTTFLIDRRGRIANRYEGAVSEAALKANLDALLAER